jgi:hypothetical protein
MPLGIVKGQMQVKAPGGEAEGAKAKRERDLL